MDKSRKILIVEPDNEDAWKLFRLFADEDYDLERSKSFAEAAEKVRDIRFDCVIMDVDLPDIKGYEAVPIMKMLDPEVQIIVTANQNTRELEVNIRKHDVFYYYIKSFDRHELKLAVRDVFKKLGK